MATAFDFDAVFVQPMATAFAALAVFVYPTAVAWSSVIVFPKPKAELLAPLPAAVPTTFWTPTEVEYAPRAWFCEPKALADVAAALF